MQVLRLSLFAMIALSLPLMAGASSVPDPYAVSFWEQPYEPLPIAGGGPIQWIFREGTEGYASSRDAQLPFPVRFFDVSYDEANVASSGYVSFGPVATAGLPGAPHYGGERFNFEIPPSLEAVRTPNRLVAVFWDELLCGPGSSIRSQVVGEEPRRSYVIEWKNCHRRNPNTETFGFLNMQLWMFEGSGSLEARYGPAMDGRDGGRLNASMGVMASIEDGRIFGYPATSCNPTCGIEDWEEDRAIVYSQEADLSILELRSNLRGWAGIPLPVSIDLENLGVRSASGARARLWLNETPTLGPAALEVADSPRAPSIASGARHTLRFDATLPREAAPGEYWLIAELNPDGAIPEVTHRNNGLSIPLTVGGPLPDLAVGPIDAPSEARAGSTLDVEWLARNLGGAPATDVSYSVRLTDSDTVSTSSRQLANGLLSLDAFRERGIRTRITLPDDLRAGTYRIGVLIDPDQLIDEMDVRNNDGVSKPLLISALDLEILTTTLPHAELGSPWCKLLEAQGGDGDYAWGLAAGSALPIGLSLIEAGGGEGGSPSTLLCGRPSLLGTFGFELEVRSGDRMVSQRLELEVVENGQPLAIATSSLPAATYGSRFQAELGAVGGAAPYSWELIFGSLPRGVHLEAGGELVGMPLEEGSFLFGVRALDRAGQVATRELLLVVTSPLRFGCELPVFPTLRPGVSFEWRLKMMGGEGAARFSTQSSRRLAGEVGEKNELLGAIPPPGLELDEDGAIGGAPSEQGRFLWMVEVVDGKGQRASCPLRLDVIAAQNLTVITEALPAATPGSPYHANLEAAGGTGALRWSLFPGSALPQGLTLDPQGTIEGTPALDAFGPAAGEERSFIVEVRDAEGRRGVSALAIGPRGFGMEQRAPAKRERGGCNAGGGEMALWSLALLGVHGMRRFERR